MTRSNDLAATPGAIVEPARSSSCGSGRCEESGDPRAHDLAVERPRE